MKMMMIWLKSEIFSTAEDATSFALSVFDLDGVAQACSISPELIGGSDSSDNRKQDAAGEAIYNRSSAGNQVNIR